MSMSTNPETAQKDLGPNPGRPPIEITPKVKPPTDDPRNPGGIGPDDQVDPRNFMSWDMMSLAMASDRNAWPDWFAMTGGGEAKLLMYSPDGTWTHDDCQIVHLAEPTSRSVNRLLELDRDADSPVSAKLVAMGALLAEMVVEYHGMKAIRRFRFGDSVILNRGDDLMTVEDLEDYVLASGADAPGSIEDIVKEYTQAFLPNRLRSMCHTAAYIMASPDLSFLRLKGREKVDEKEQAEAAAKGEEVDMSPKETSDSDPTSGEGSDGSTDSTPPK